MPAAVAGPWAHNSDGAYRPGRAGAPPRPRRPGKARRLPAAAQRRIRPPRPRRRTPRRVWAQPPRSRAPEGAGRPAAARRRPASPAMRRKAGTQEAEGVGARRAHRLSHHGPFTEFDGHVGHHSFLPGFSGTALDGVRRICPLSFPAGRGAFPEERHKPRAGRISMAGYPQL